VLYKNAIGQKRKEKGKKKERKRKEKGSNDCSLLARM